MQQIQEAASVYSIPVNPGAPPGSYQSEMDDASQLNLGQTSPLDLSRLDIGTPLNYVIPSTVPMSESIPFPPYDRAP
jgi:hypothetical protein